MLEHSASACMAVMLANNLGSAETSVGLGTQNIGPRTHQPPHAQNTAQEGVEYGDKYDPPLSGPKLR